MTDKEYKEWMEGLVKIIQEGTQSIVDKACASDDPINEVLTIIYYKIADDEEFKGMERKTTEQAVTLAALATYLYFLEVSK